MLTWLRRLAPACLLSVTCACGASAQTPVPTFTFQPPATPPPAPLHIQPPPEALNYIRPQTSTPEAPTFQIPAPTPRPRIIQQARNTGPCFRMRSYNFPSGSDSPAAPSSVTTCTAANSSSVRNATTLPLR